MKALEGGCPKRFHTFHPSEATGTQLIRYYTVDPELALSLIPPSPFHGELLKKYYECQRLPDTSFVLTDDIYDARAHSARMIHPIIQVFEERAMLLDMQRSTE